MTFAWVLAAALQASGDAPAPAEAAPRAIVTPAPEKVRRVTTDKLEHLRTEHEVVVVDVRTPPEYRAGHVAGALSWPYVLDEQGYRKLRLNREAWIVTYCTCADEYTGAMAAQKLIGAGFPRVATLKGGFIPWKETGRPVHRGDRP